MLTVASYLWEPQTGDAPYSLGDVKLWRDMVHRHLTVPHEFVCITDNVEQFEGTGIRPVPLDPACHIASSGMFQQLMPFHPDAESLIGKRILTMDLDCAVVGNMDGVVSRDEDLVLWRNPGRRPWDNPTGKGVHRALFNTSMILVTAGARTDIWTRFFAVPGVATDYVRYRFGKRTLLGQDYVSAMVGPKCAYWDDDDGVYRLAREDTPGSGITGDLPANASIVFFVGSQHKPWLPEIKARFPWISTHRY